jgi:serine/threonine protein kinase/tetratricopeptide (TPR) repeat protein
MKTNPGGVANESANVTNVTGVLEHEIRTCPACGTKFSASGTAGVCPVCMLRGGLRGESASSKAPDTASALEHGFEQREPTSVSRRFENYELMVDERGTPIELGRGAMGITYKAFDVDLRCPVTLKVINERYIGEESARRRFLREARSAASLHHTNVASVFHLGRSGKDYFYAMEFVEGETLESLIKRSGRLDMKLALEITTQVASGLAAVHKEKLVHRDIKPSNIMVRLEVGGAVTAKIIDLGLAKATVHEAGSQTAISALGGFAGTPEFASPEQFAGVGVDIRSDLYSLGVTLWEMLTGRTPFEGMPAEVMHQHLHAALPLSRLAGITQPVVVLLEVLLEKNPKLRFQSPLELIKAMPTIIGAIGTGSRITRQSLQKKGVRDSATLPSSPVARLGPKKISIARLPVTGSNFFGREADIVFLDEAWANQQVNIVTVVAWAGAGKSTLLNQWLLRMAAEHYRSAELVFGWSFYRQGTGGGASSADEFLDATLSWFGDPDPRRGTAWEKGERLAKLVAHRRTLLILDGLEPLQNPPGAQEGRLRDPSLQALLGGLATFMNGLCVITTRLPVADLADGGRRLVLRYDLEQLSSEAGAQLLRALSVIGDEEKLRSASDDFDGHCLALTLLGSYLTDAHNGDIRCCKEISDRLGHDKRQGFHARKVMESYQNWLGEGPELSVLRVLGLFDRPADEKALEALLRPPAIQCLTESLVDLNPVEWRAVLSRLRRARLLSAEDPHNPGHLDTHPLVREYFGEQLQSQRTEAWKECNRRLYQYYRELAPQLPDSFREMEPLFLAVICACNVGLLHDALREVYLPRIQRDNKSFAANVLGVRGALLSALAPFFEQGHWGSLRETGVEGQRLSAEDKLFILTQAGLYLTATRGLASAEAQDCYRQAESLCHSLNRPVLLYATLINQWRYTSATEKLTTAMQIADRIYSLAKKQNDPALLIGAYGALANTLCYLGNFEAARLSAMRGVEIWRSGGVKFPVEEIVTPPVSCLIYEAYSEWFLGEIAACQANTAEAISLAKELKDMNALAFTLYLGGILAFYQRNPVEVERLASELIELSARYNFAFWLPGANVLRGWARSVCGDTSEGISWIERGIEDYRASGSMPGMPLWLSVKAEAMCLADRSAEALEAIEEAEAMAKRFEIGSWYAELKRLRGVSLAALNGDETRIEASFRAAIKIAREQKAVSLEKRAEANYAEYRARKTA